MTTMVWWDTLYRVDDNDAAGTMISQRANNGRRRRARARAWSMITMAMTMHGGDDDDDGDDDGLPIWR